MFIAYVIVAALMSAVLLASAGAKLTKKKSLVDQMVALDVPIGILPFLGAAQLAGTVGLISGIWWAPLGVAAAVGVLLYFIGAVGSHLRARDFRGMPPAAVLGTVAAVLVGLGAATL
jgi:hypothetical protein